MTKVLNGKTLSKYVVMFTVLLLLGAFLFISSRLEAIYASRIYDSAIEFKKNYLRDTVNNLVSDIEDTKADSIEMYNYIILSGKDWVRTHVAQQGPDAMQAYFAEQIGQPGWAYFVYETGSKQVKQDNWHLFENGWDGKEASLEKLFAARSTVRYRDQTIVYGVLRSTMDQAIEDMYRKKIHRETFIEGSYIWVNKVLNWNGGEGYAVRLIHPNMLDDEGRLLSTSTKDIKGGLPYLEELEGIRENNGEYFYSYYFKKLDSEEIGRKLTYAKLYPDYNWIICMGAYYDEIEQNVSSVRSGQRSILRITGPIAAVLLTLLLLGLFLQIHNDQKRFDLTTEKLKRKADLDPLTQANSRAFGEEELDFAWRKFQNSVGSTPALMIMDIDEFKKINDTFGHDAGDQVLKTVVSTVYSSIRSTDTLTRWGGDEFLALFHGLNKENVPVLAEKILKTVRLIKVTLQDGSEIAVTVSLGFTFFETDDVNYKDAVKRADNALYKSKAGGKNQFTLL